MINPPRVRDKLQTTAAAVTDEGSFDGVHLASAPVDDHADHVEITASRLAHVAFTGLTLDHLRLTDVIVEDCEFSGTSLTEAVFVRARFVRCRMSGLIAVGLRSTDVEWIDCKIDEANFRNVAWERCAFRDCLLPGADFYGATLREVRFERCDISRCEFSKAKLDGVRLHRSTLEGIRGANSMKGAIIGSDQIVSFALPLFAAIGIVVDDEISDLGG